MEVTENIYYKTIETRCCTSLYITCKKGHFIQLDRHQFDAHYNCACPFQTIVKSEDEDEDDDAAPRKPSSSSVPNILPDFKIKEEPRDDEDDESPPRSKRRQQRRKERHDSSDENASPPRQRRRRHDSSGKDRHFDFSMQERGVAKLKCSLLLSLLMIYDGEMITPVLFGVLR